MSRHSFIRYLPCAVVLGLAGAAAAQAPDPRIAGATVQGKVRPIAQEQLLLDAAHASYGQRVRQNTRALLDIVQRNPALSPPLGLDIAPFFVVRTPAVGVNRHIVQYDLGEGFYWYTSRSGNQIVPESVSGAALYLHANHISPAFKPSETWVEDETKQTYWEPRQIGEQAGHPYYDSHALVIKKTGRPIWIPLTNEQVLARMLDNAKKAQAGLPPEAETRVRELAKQDVSCYAAAFARLTATARREPAYLTPLPRGAECSPLADASVPQARRLVRENPDFYDKTVSPADIQVVVLNFGAIQYPPRLWQHAVVKKLQETMDYAALQAMIR